MILYQKLLCIAAAGSLGTLSRYGLAGLVQRLAGGGFPWGTATVNIIGCFLFGLIWTLGADRMAIGAETRTIILTGFMGAFTTFSTFISETGQLAVGAQWWVAMGNIVLQVGAGLALFAAGAALARLI
ncbi:fluoride efflux transporter FluC [Desulfoluna butyratoxydans]|uniref:Fluoride-specific ion channel FluC n=1 Tax=Desulfoluna butyratoxydans TaxID=231438 RepID=A0A4U8YGU8_9BACT|nr:CrcB family protein [Desulfoluna butyratoxydans]VFQ42711.1 putative fluoride ion transporter crcb [Desulfoluna butyratoxydans]